MDGLGVLPAKNRIEQPRRREAGEVIYLDSLEGDGLAEHQGEEKRGDACGGIVTRTVSEPTTDLGKTGFEGLPRAIAGANYEGSGPIAFRQAEPLQDRLFVRSNVVLVFTDKTAIRVVTKPTAMGGEIASSKSMNIAFVVRKAEIGETGVAEIGQVIDGALHHAFVVEIDLIPGGVRSLMPSLNEEGDSQFFQKLTLWFGVVFPSPEDHGITRSRAGDLLKMTKDIVLGGKVRDDEVVTAGLEIVGEGIDQAAVSEAVVETFQSAIDEGDGVGLAFDESLGSGAGLIVELFRGFDDTLSRFFRRPNIGAFVKNPRDQSGREIQMIGNVFEPGPHDMNRFI